MRTATKSAIGILSLGVIAASYTAGTAAQIGFGAATVSETTSASSETAPIAESTTSEVATAPTQTSETTAPAATTTTSSSKTTAATTTKPTATQTATATTAAPTPLASKTATAPTPTPTKTSSATAALAKTGSAINYKYGTIQLEVVKSGSKITAVNLIQASTSGRDWASVPSILVTAAMTAQGSGFGNMSGATFTTTAFKSALDSALAKF